jgi:hypothetical protein
MLCFDNEVVNVYSVVHPPARSVASSALPSLTPKCLSATDRHVWRFMLPLTLQVVTDHNASRVPRSVHRLKAHTGISSCTDPWLGTDGTIALGAGSTSRGSTVSQWTTQVWSVTSRLQRVKLILSQLLFNFRIEQFRP